jgi:hypothetical protein
MIRKLIFAALLPICLALALPARCQQPSSYELLFSPAPGSVLIYNLTSRMNSEGKSFLGVNLSLGVQAGGEIDLAVRQKSSDSVFAELSSPGVRVSLQVLGQPNEFTLATPADSPVLMIFDRAGRVRSVRNTERIERRNPLNFSVMDMLRNYLPTLPDKPIAVGDSWQDHKRLQIPFQEMRLLVEIEITFFLRDVVPSPQGELALVAATYSVHLTGSRELENVTGKFEGRGAGTGSLSFLIDKGCFTNYRLDYSLDGAMILSGGEGKLAEWPFTLSESAELTLVEWR